MANATSVDDIKHPDGEPSYVGVAICVGSDLQGQPVTLLDRLCVNRAAAQQLRDNVDICVQQEKAFGRDVETLTIQRDNARDVAKEATWVYGFATLLLLVIGAIIIWRRN